MQHYDEVGKWLAAGQRFSPGTLVSITFDRHDKTEIFVKRNKTKKPQNMNNNEPLNYFSVFFFSKPLNYLNTNLVEMLYLQCTRGL
jgi:hypothetical protein